MYKQLVGRSSSKGTSAIGVHAFLCMSPIIYKDVNETTYHEAEASMFEAEAKASMLEGKADRGRDQTFEAKAKAEANGM
jgi:hypothetical protein